MGRFSARSAATCRGYEGCYPLYVGGWFFLRRRLLARRCSPTVAQYAVSTAYRIRFYMRMNAREAMHVIELSTSPQGHPAYRRACQRIHRLIAEEVGHAALGGRDDFRRLFGSRA